MPLGPQVNLWTFLVIPAGGGGSQWEVVGCCCCETFQEEPTVEVIMLSAPAQIIILV
jgi:hypothetical protein